MVVPDPIQQNKVEKKNVGGVVGFTRRKTIPIHHKPQLPNMFPLLSWARKTTKIGIKTRT
jgi:hypothetical protein